MKNIKDKIKIKKIKNKKENIKSNNKYKLLIIIVENY